jgi:phenylacetate-CoA ligase
MDHSFPVSKRSLELFRKAARELPAYKHFLEMKRFDADKVQEIDDYSLIPLTSKKGYLQLFPHKDLVWDTDWNAPLWFCSTSGSTGEPYYFPRNDELARQASEFARDFIKYSSYGKTRTLVIMAFGMGVWIGGVMTLRAFEIAAQELGSPTSFLPTGYNKQEIFKALKKLSPQYDQTILVGYPPFVKEIIDEAKSEGIDLKKLHMRLMFAAEAFTERFRDYVCKKAGIANPLLDTLNIYGTADIGAMAHETPLSILARRLIIEDPLLIRDAFGQIEKTPTLAQFNPEFINFEDVEGQIVLTGNAALPLIRYAVGDHGGIMSYERLEQLLRKYKINLNQEIKKAGIEHTVQKRPFVFVYERVDLSATLHGIIIYPEFIKEALLKPRMNSIFTERFTMATKTDIHHNQFLRINLELRNGTPPSEIIKERALMAIRKTLIEKSSEFAEISKSRLNAELIKVVLWKHGHPRYFAPGTKQKWVEKV